MTLKPFFNHLFSQIHPLGLCNTSEDGDLYEYGWVGVVKLTPPDNLNEPCFTLIEKVRLTFQTLAKYLFLISLSCSFSCAKCHLFRLY